MTTDLLYIAWAQLWQVTLLTLLIALPVHWLGRNRPHLAHALWLVVLAKCLTPPLWSSPGGMFCWLQPTAGVVRAENAAARLLPIPTAVDSAAARGNEVVVHVRRPDKRKRSQVANRDVPVDAAFQAIESPAEPADRHRTDWRGRVAAVLACIWLTGFSLIAAAAAWRWCRCWRMLLAAGRIDDPQLDALLARLSKQLGIHCRVRLLISRSRVGPAVIGILRPTVILPVVVVNGKLPHQLEPILAHELLHVRRGDLWIGLLQTLAHAVWWFHPLVWIVNRLITREAERCCDEQVIGELGCPPAAYARSLLDVLSLKRSLKVVPAFPGVRPVEVTSKRLERIMQLGQGCRRRTPWWCWLVLLMLAAVALPGAAFHAAAQERESSRELPHAAKDIGPWKTPDSTASAGRAPNSAHTTDAPLVAKVYDLSDLVAKLREEQGLDANGARWKLREWLETAAGAGDTRNGHKLVWSNDALLVACPAAGHERLTALLEGFRKHGFLQVKIEVAIGSGPQASVEKVFGPWDGLTKSAPDSADSRFDSLVRSRGADDVPSEEHATPRGQMRQTIEKQMPLTSSLFDASGRTELLRMLQSDAHANLITCPRVTLFNGQTAKVVDATQRPFVVGVKPDGAGGEQPQVRIVTEGLVLRLKPAITDKKKVHLDCEISLSDIRRVETATIRRRKQPPLTVQVPEVATTRVETQAELPDGLTLVLGGLCKRGEHDKPQSLLVLLRATVEPIMETPETQREAKRPQHAAVSPQNDVLHVTGEEAETPLVTQVYAVADLVVPLPQPDAKPRPDFEPLIKLITESVAPESWNDKGGTGSLAPFESNLSLVISQTADVHEQIADLLEELRRLQDVQVTLTLEPLRMSPEHFRDAYRGRIAGNPQPLSNGQRRRLRETLDADRKVEKLQSPKITLFGGQPAEIAQGDISLKVVAAVSHDRRRVRLSLSVGADDALGVLAGARKVSVEDGQSLVFDVTEEQLASRYALPWLKQSPALRRRLADAATQNDGDRVLLIVTPRILVQEEEEEVVEPLR